MHDGPLLPGTVLNWLVGESVQLRMCSKSGTKARTSGENLFEVACMAKESWLPSSEMKAILLPEGGRGSLERLSHSQLQNKCAVLHHCFGSNNSLQNPSE